MDPETGQSFGNQSQIGHEIFDLVQKQAKNGLDSFGKLSKEKSPLLTPQFNLGSSTDAASY